MGRYCKRLIEVDLPIKRISNHARREKSIRHGHISTLHIWWARRPLAACRAVICASLWPDPVDDLCPEEFRTVAREEMNRWSKNHLDLLSKESHQRFFAISKGKKKLTNTMELRKAILDFISDFSNWDNSNVDEFLTTARKLTNISHKALNKTPSNNPIVVDPFSGGGAIPLEAMRVGADVFSSDLNPVAVLLNKVMLDYVPKFGQKMVTELRECGDWIQKRIEEELTEFYPKDTNGRTPIAYIWARTIDCEGPNCGCRIPLIRSLWLAKKEKIALKVVSKEKKIEFQVIKNASPKDVQDGTVKRGSASCPSCGYTTPVNSVRKQLSLRNGGVNDARLIAVVTTKLDKKGRFFRLPEQRDFEAIRKAETKLKEMEKEYSGKLPLIPNETIPLMSGVFNVPLYGHTEWGHLFSPRQKVVLTTLVRLTRDLKEKLKTKYEDSFVKAIQTCMALVVDRMADRGSSLCRYDPSPNMSGINNTFSRQALGMVWDFGEGNVTIDRSGGWSKCLSWIISVFEQELSSFNNSTSPKMVSATNLPLPDDSVQCFLTDPPYYNAVPYADLSDFFYVWLKRSIGDLHPELFESELTPKKRELCEMAGWDSKRYAHKDGKWFEKQMLEAMLESYRVLSNDGIGVIVFAHKSTLGWEAMLKAIVKAGLVITASWPIDTEMGSRLRAMNSAALSSSIHLVFRPGKDKTVGDWRDVLSELSNLIKGWLSRLTSEGVVGADAIFACIGPSLEIYSRYSLVEKASGENVDLSEYLEHVWASIAKEALSMIFEEVDTSGFEEDARLTAMWLWTLKTSQTNLDEENSDRVKKIVGYSLKYDAARKISQGLGANLEKLSHLVEVKGSTATLFSASTRSAHLFDSKVKKKFSAHIKSNDQLKFDFEPGSQQIKNFEDDWDKNFGSSLGETTLDQVHKCMILFASGRREAVRRFLVEEGIGKNILFWRLAQALSALYPSGTDDKRWVDGVLARKKSLGF